jgi:hypothetical protein
MTENSERNAEFSMSYEGEALDQNIMDVKDLAPALLSLGQAFERANSLLNGDKAEISLNIHAIRPGSFDIALILNQLLNHASGVLSPDWLTNAIALRDLLIGTPIAALSLVLLIKQLKGKKPKQTETKDGIVFEAEHLKLTVPMEIARLYNDKPIRDHIEVLARPLIKTGIDKVVFRDKNKKELGVIHSSEVKYFDSFDNEGKDTTEFIIPRQRLQITSLTFKDGKWSLNDGANTHWYSMDDHKFIDEIENGKSFGKYHILVCEVVLTQTIQANGKLKMDYSVKKVIKHIITGEQLPLKDKDE